jgi:hypothetical protein
MVLATAGLTGIIFVSDYMHDKLYVTRKEDKVAEDIRSEYTETTIIAIRPTSGSINKIRNKLTLSYNVILRY